MNLGTAQVIRANARDLPLADNSVDLVVTSPPYFALRSYQDGGEHYRGQIGDEPTPAEFVASLLEVTRECVRVLKPSGSLWVNLGDKYAGSRMDGSSGNGSNGTLNTRKVDGEKMQVVEIGAAGQGAKADAGNVRQKSLIGIPWRYALACIDDLGLILRAEVIWSKPNGLPESVTDRVRRSHEQWFHFTLEPRYFSAVDEIREGYAPGTAERYRSGYNPTAVQLAGQTANGVLRVDGGGPSSTNPLGKLPGSVWTVDGGESVTRSVLSAVAAGALTIEEGERILWTSSASCGTSSPSNPGAGSGADGAMHAATGRPASDATSSGHTASPTRSTSDPSQTVSPSTTSAATGDASTLTTSSPSLSQRTSDVPTPSGRPADAATTSQTPTSRSHATAGSTDAAGSATASDSVWVVPTEPLRVPEHLGIDHFAAFPTEFPRRIIQGWSPSGVCVECGEGRRPVSDRDAVTLQEVGGRISSVPGAPDHREGARKALSVTITGYACACPEPTAATTPAVVLDPFGGTGTTALVAKALGRHGITVDMSADYCRLAEWRTSDRNQLAKVLGIEKAPTVDVEQLDLFGEATA